MTEENVSALIAVEDMGVVKADPVQRVTPYQVFRDDAVAKFELMQRQAVLLSKSNMIPQCYQNNIGNVYFAMLFAESTGLNPGMVMQKAQPIKGKMGMEATLALTLFDMYAPFTGGINYEHKNENTDNWTCRAYAKRRDTGEVVYGPVISLDMAKKRGWWGGSENWKHSPQLMLEYRSASWFIKTRCPGVLFGADFKDELEDHFGRQPANRSALNDELTEVVVKKAPE